MGNHFLSLTLYPYLYFPSATQLSNNSASHCVPWVRLALDHTVRGIKQTTTSGHLRAGTVPLPHQRSYHNLGNKNESTSKKSHLGCPASSLLELQCLLGFWNNVAQKAGLPGTEFLLLGSSQLLSLPAFSLHWQFIGCPTPIFFFPLKFFLFWESLILDSPAHIFPLYLSKNMSTARKKKKEPSLTEPATVPRLCLLTSKYSMLGKWNRSSISVLPPACTFILALFGSSQKALEDGLKHPCLPAHR